MNMNSDMRAFSDEEIKTVIVDHLGWNTGVDASKILVMVENGVITLSGTAGSYSEKQEAFKTARHVSGVRSVKNEIMVFTSPNKQPVSDEDIEAAIEQAFSWNPHIYEEDIKFHVKEGVVTLTGCVRHYSQRLKAETIVSELSGVKEIVDELSTVCTEKIEDELIKKSIMDEIESTDPLAARNVKISVVDGFADISGSVYSYPEENRIFDIVSHKNGITGINNNLEVIISPGT